MSMVDEFRKRFQDRIQSVRANIEQFRPGILKEGGFLSSLGSGNLLSNITNFGDAGILSGQIIENIRNRVKQVTGGGVLGGQMTRTEPYKQVVPPAGMAKRERRRRFTNVLG